MAHVPQLFLSEWREFPLAPCFAGRKNYDSSRLHVVETARASDMLPSVCVRIKDLQFGP